MLSTNSEFHTDAYPYLNKHIKTHLRNQPRLKLLEASNSKRASKQKLSTRKSDYTVL